VDLALAPAMPLRKQLLLQLQQWLPHLGTDAGTSRNGGEIAPAQG
jgi:hypothetical protein